MPVPLELGFVPLELVFVPLELVFVSLELFFVPPELVFVPLELVFVPMELVFVPPSPSSSCGCNTAVGLTWTSVFMTLYITHILSFCYIHFIHIILCR